MDALIRTIIILAIVVALGIILAILEKKKITSSDKVLSYSYKILEMLENSGVADEKTKEILRMIMNCVKYVEDNFKAIPNTVKEDTALNLVNEKMENMNLREKLTDEEIRTLVRLSAVMLGNTERKEEINEEKQQWK